jgi:hypothetical protein
MVEAVRRYEGTVNQMERSNTMGFYEVLDQAVALLRRRGRATYRALKRELDLDDARLEDLKHELINAQRLAVDEREHLLPRSQTAASRPRPSVSCTTCSWQ